MNKKNGYKLKQTTVRRHHSNRNELHLQVLTLFCQPVQRLIKVKSTLKSMSFGTWPPLHSACSQTTKCWMLHSIQQATPRQQGAMEINSNDKPSVNLSANLFFASWNLVLSTFRRHPGLNWPLCQSSLAPWSSDKIWSAKHIFLVVTL